MRHRTARRLMSLAMDGCIAREEESQLLAHVERCARCRGVWAAMLRADNILKDAPLVEVPETLLPAVLSRLPARRRAVTAVPSAWSRAGLLVGLAAGAVALVALIGVLLLAAGVWPAALGGGPGGWAAELWSAVRALVRAAGPVARAVGHAFGVVGLLLALGLAVAGVVLWIAFWRLGNRR
ncbi:MAG: anti-sigma factor family protein [Chloroflexia bacterium]